MICSSPEYSVGTSLLHKVATLFQLSNGGSKLEVHSVPSTGHHTVDRKRHICSKHNSGAPAAQLPQEQRVVHRRPSPADLWEQATEAQGLARPVLLLHHHGHVPDHASLNAQRCRPLRSESPPLAPVRSPTPDTSAHKLVASAKPARHIRVLWVCILCAARRAHLVRRLQLVRLLAARVLQQLQQVVLLAHVLRHLPHVAPRLRHWVRPRAPALLMRLLLRLQRRRGAPQRTATVGVRHCRGLRAAPLPRQLICMPRRGGRDRHRAATAAA